MNAVPPRNERHRFVVPAGPSLRVDLFLTRRLAGISRRQVRSLIANGRVQINGRKPRKGDLVRQADVVTVDASRPPLAGQPELLIPLLLVDESLLVLDKPSGVPSVALRAEDRNTVGNFLVALESNLLGIGSRLECGVAHRLDTDTSGVLVVARNETAYSDLRRQFTAGTVSKRYLALVRGRLTGSGKVSWPIAHTPGRRRRMTVCRLEAHAGAIRARRACTRYRVLGRYGDVTLVLLSIRTGVRHQVRVHMSSIGHPVLGDPIYGAQVPHFAPRLMLHASSIRFRHPARGKSVLVRAPLPTDFSLLLGKLGEDGD